MALKNKPIFDVEFAAWLTVLAIGAVMAFVSILDMLMVLNGTLPFWSLPVFVLAGAYGMSICEGCLR